MCTTLPAATLGSPVSHPLAKEKAAAVGLTRTPFGPASERSWPASQGLAPLRGAIRPGFLRSSRNRRRISGALFSKEHLMKKLHLLPLLMAVLVVCTATAAQAAKIEICHRPPGNPGNWHTITINDTAWSAHQAHGDLIGSCVSNCGTLCDDGNKCTIDFVPSSTECLCQAAPRPAVDCSDGLACTTDSCDPTQGCANTPVVCQAPDRCTASVCSEPGGTCQNTPVACPTGQACNPSTGACEGTLPKCGNCLIDHDSPGCEVAACQARVCGFSPMCCTDSWTEGNGGPCEQQGYFSCALGGMCTP